MLLEILPNQILEENKHTIKKLANNDLILKLLKCGFKKESEISRINENAGIQPVVVPKEVFVALFLYFYKTLYEYPYLIPRGWILRISLGFVWNLARKDAETQRIEAVSL